MKTRLLLKVGLVGMACMVAATGCRKTGAARGGADSQFADDILNPMGIDGGMTGEGLGPRFGSLFSDLTPIPGDFAPVYFDYDSSTLSAGERGKVDPVVDIMLGNPRAMVRLEGHCDERGSREYNMALGEHRAITVLNYLAERGVDRTRIETISYGEEQPAALGHTESDYRLNRRVEFRLGE